MQIHSKNNINTQLVVSAFQAILQPNSQNVSMANQYLRQCEKSPYFPQALIQIFLNCQDPQIQLQSILLLGNVIKRNWMIKRNAQATSLQQHKKDIRGQILRVYYMKMPNNINHIDQIIKFLARQDYPTHYPQLHAFILQTLNNLNANDQDILSRITNNTLHQLKTVKRAIKQYSLKRIMLQNDDFMNYILAILQITTNLQQKLSAVVNNITNMQQLNAQTILLINQRVLNIILLSMECMPSHLQTKVEFMQVVAKFMNKVNTYSQMLTVRQDLRVQLEKCIHTIVKKLGSLQIYYPFLFNNVLAQYLQMLINMTMFPQNYKYQKLHMSCISSLTKPFQTFAYYCKEKQFKQSLQARKSNVNHSQDQIICHAKFISVFNPSTISLIFQKILLELLEYFGKDSLEQQIMFDDADPSSCDVILDKNPSELLILLMRNIMKCFKVQSKGMIQQALSQAISNNAMNTKLFQNLIEMVILMPKVFDSADLPLELIMNLLNALYSNSQYYLFARLIRNFHNHLDVGSVNKSFDILCLLVSSATNIDSQTLYQCAVCIKRIMSEHDELPMNHLQGCIQRIMELYLIYYKNPNLLWPLINLTIQLIKSLSDEMLEKYLQPIINKLQPIMNIQYGQELIICAICQLIDNLLTICKHPSVSVLQKCLVIIVYNIKNKNIESISNVHSLWLKIIECYESNNQLLVNDMFVKLFQECSQLVLEQNEELYISLVEEYMLSGLINVSAQQLWMIYEKCLFENQQMANHNSRIIISMFSLYFSYAIKQNTFLPNFVILVIKYILIFAYNISPSNNQIRTLLLTIFHHHIYIYGPQPIYNCLQSNWNDYREWFLGYCWSMEYASNKYSYKVNSVGILRSIQWLNDRKILTTPISNQVPLDTIMKVLLLGLEPLKTQQSIGSYQHLFRLAGRVENVRRDYIPRKIRLQFMSNICQVDLRPMFRQVIPQIFVGWKEQNFRERFDKSIADKIILTLSTQQYTLQFQDLR